MKSAPRRARLHVKRIRKEGAAKSGRKAGSTEADAHDGEDASHVAHVTVSLREGYARRHGAERAHDAARDWRPFEGASPWLATKVCREVHAVVSCVLLAG